MELRSVEEIPAQFREIFSPIKFFFLTPSTVFDDVMFSDKHLAVCAPTGSGKTTVLELAIVELLTYLKKISYDLTNFKIIYIAPTKALCNEIFSVWQNKFRCVNLSIMIATGDSDPESLSDLGDIEPFNIIITTPEKWDSLTRRWTDFTAITDAIKLVLIDEVHLLNDEQRGASLEAIVSRMKTFSIQEQLGVQNMNQEFNERNIRFIAVSATMPNIEDIGKWIGSGSAYKSFLIPIDKRPIKLERFVYGYPAVSNSFQFENRLTYKLNNIIQKHNEGKPILIFCQSRSSVENTVNYFQNEYPFNVSDNQKTRLKDISNSFHNQKLKVAISHGIAFHHAGLTHDDRGLVENLFRDRLIPILVCTSTLAMGINLPAHMVIIKSTEIFNKGVVEEVSENIILQMIGRAGRPQFDSSGTIIIMTKEEQVKKYENLVSGTMPVESHLYKQMLIYLNAEIALNTVIDKVDDVLKWLRSTFLYVRAMANPKKYGIDTHPNCIEIVERELQEMCLKQIKILEEFELVTISPEYDNKLRCTPFGRIMARFYLSLDTMKKFAALRGNENISMIFAKIVQCNEFSHFYLRANEKRLLNEINNGKNDKFIKFPIEGKIDNVSKKISCLLQAVLGNIPINDLALEAESIEMCELAEILAKGLIEYFRSKQFQRSNFQSVLSSVILVKCFRAKLWMDSPFVSKQLNDVSAEESMRLADNGVDSISAISNSRSQVLKLLLNQRSEFSQKLINSAAALSRYRMEIEVMEEKCIRIKVMQINENDKTFSPVTLLIGDCHNNMLKYKARVENVLLEYGSYEKEINFTYNTVYISAFLIHKNYVGIDEIVQVRKQIGAKATSIPYLSRIFKTKSLIKDSVSAVKAKPPMELSKQSAIFMNYFKKPNDVVPLQKENTHKLQDSQVNQDATGQSSGKYWSQLKKFKAPIKNQIKLQQTENLYNFDYDNTQSTIASKKSYDVNGKSNNGNDLKQSKLSFNYVNEYLTSRTPITKKIIGAKKNENDFVTAKSIFNTDKLIISQAKEQTNKKLELLDNIFENCQEDGHECKEQQSILPTFSPFRRQIFQSNSQYEYPSSSIGSNFKPIIANEDKNLKNSISSILNVSVRISENQKQHFDEELINNSENKCLNDNFFNDSCTSTSTEYKNTTFVKNSEILTKTSINNNHPITNALKESKMQHKFNFMAKDSPKLERKKQKLNITELLANGAMQRGQKNIASATKSDITFNKNQLKKSTNKQVFARVKRSIGDQRQDRMQFIENFREQLKHPTDPTYTKRDIETDYARLIVGIPIENNSRRQCDENQYNFFDRMDMNDNKDNCKYEYDVDSRSTCPRFDAENFFD